MMEFLRKFAIFYIYSKIPDCILDNHGGHPEHIFDSQVISMVFHDGYRAFHFELAYVDNDHF